MITFTEHHTPGYPARTKENVLRADLTIAIALDFKTRGEVLTRQICEDFKKHYLDVAFYPTSLGNSAIESFVTKLNSIHTDFINLNIAGNGIYALPTEQKACDYFVFELLKRIQSHPAFSKDFITVRSGGQTGIDEAGIYAAERLQMPTMVLAPRGWMFRNKAGVDVYSEAEFKKRFVKD
jgi:hypothetical protein